MAQQGTHNTGMFGGTAVGSYVAGQHNGPQQQVHNRDQRIQDGYIGALTSGDNNQGPMTANTGQERTEDWDPMKATSADVQNLLRQEECDDNTIAIFKKKKINGRMLLKLSQEDLNQYGLTDEDEKKRVLDIIKDVQDGKLKLN
ncbi:uncharacterized protein LOC124124430 [Haliotis rufescens]|uniref:uncharacterized protein LOC124124430 n=1 Tax=Haliotis rufescens TaxID=6454 RepID=UPI00201F7733|nr:uncharacterized protein LOC124124430 [Haliotis rufescens]